jgi:hypothetical protein
MVRGPRRRAAGRSAGVGTIALDRPSRAKLAKIRGSSWLHSLPKNSFTEKP